MKTELSDTLWVWRWTDGNTFEYNNTYLDDAETSEYCARLYQLGVWRRTNCTETHESLPFNFICKKALGSIKLMADKEAKVPASYVAVGVIVGVIVVVAVVATVIVCLRRRKKTSKRHRPGTQGRDTLYDTPAEYKVQASGPSTETAKIPDNGRLGEEQQVNSRVGKLSGSNKHSSRNNLTSSGSGNGLSIDNPVFDAQEDDVFFSTPSGSLDAGHCEGNNPRIDLDQLEMHNNHNYEGHKPEQCVITKPQFDLSDLEVFEKLAYENRTVY